MAIADLPGFGASGDNRFPPSQRLAVAARDVLRLLRRRRARYVAVVHATNRSQLDANHQSKDVYFDDLLSQLDDYYKIEHVDNPVFLHDGRIPFSPSDITSTAFRLLAGGLARFHTPRAVADTAHSVAAILNAELGPGTLAERRVRLILSHFFWSKRVLAWFLGQMRPRYLLVLTAYCDHAIVAAARELGIEVVEFQHGLVDRNHWGYSWSNYASKYKSKMPIPDRILLYGEHWRRELASQGFWGDELRVVGSPRIDHYRQLRVIKPETRTIVVTTQGLDTDRLVEYLSAFLRLAVGRLDFQLCLKLHPLERSKKPYESGLGEYPNVRILLNSEPPSTFDLIAQAHMHASVSSTCHYESLALGVPTAVLPFATHEGVAALVEEGHAIPVGTPQDLLDAVLQAGSAAFPTEVGEFYFRSGALESMRRELVT